MSDGTPSAERHKSYLQTKLGQPSSSTPRTLESKRSQLAPLFSSLFIASEPEGSSSTPSATDLNHDENTYHTPSKPSTPNLVTGHPQSRTRVDCDEGCYVDGEDRLHEVAEHHDPGCARSSKSMESPSGLMDLPDELLVYILLQLPPSARQVLTVSLFSRRFFELSQSPALWYNLFLSTPGFELSDNALSRGIAVPTPPGLWDAEDNYIFGVSSPSPISTPRRLSTASSHRAKSPKSPLSPLSFNPIRSPGEEPATDPIPIHYPTLYRSRLALSRLIHNPAPTSPPHRVTLERHTDSVYCLHLVPSLLFTGSRDRSVHVWRLPDLGTTARPSQSLSSPKLLQVIERAHGGSVLAIRYEADEEHEDHAGSSSGTMVTGSSDLTAMVWSVHLAAMVGSKAENVVVKRVATLTGHTGGVLGVALTPRRIVTCSKDTTIRIYDRASYDHLFTCTTHISAVNSLSIDLSRPSDQIVSASGDGQWIMWDLTTGKEIKQGSGQGRGLASVIWDSDYVVTGDNDRLIKIFSASTSSLLKTIESHTDLVRAVSIDLSTRTLVSGSYDSSIRLWDLDSGELIRRVQGGERSMVFAVEIKSGRVAIASHDHTVQILTFGVGLPYRDLFV